MADDVSNIASQQHGHAPNPGGPPVGRHSTRNPLHSNTLRSHQRTGHEMRRASAKFVRRARSNRDSSPKFVSRNRHDMVRAPHLCRRCLARRERRTHPKFRRVSALRQPRADATRHAQEETRDRAAVAVRVMQAHVHARPRGDPQQDLSPAHGDRCALDLQSRLLARRHGRSDQIEKRPPDRRSTMSRLACSAHGLMSYLRLRDHGPTSLPSRTDYPLDQVVPPANLPLRRSTGRSSSSCVTASSMISAAATRASRPSQIFWKRCRSSVRTISSAQKIVVARRKRNQRSRTSRASSSTAKRISRRALPA